MDVMKPIASDITPTGDEWLYEVKYDGFRCVLYWEKNRITLTSKNNQDLTENFPEIIEYCHGKQRLVAPYLPVKLDGELVVLNNAYQANFSWIQKRGRIKRKEAIQQASRTRPATFMVFDLLAQKGENLYHQDFQYRKKVLKALFTTTGFDSRMRLIHAYERAEQLWSIIGDYKGEGMVAKRKKSVYDAGKKHHDWFKIKNWRTIQAFITEMNPENGYFTVGVYEQDKVKHIGTCKHGLDQEEMHTLTQLFRTKGDKQENGYSLPPAICASIYTLDLYKEELREPEWNRLLLSSTPSECTTEKLTLDMAMIPSEIELTNTAKVFWPEEGLTKGDLLVFIREVSPYMLPFLKEKALTIIRSPDGIKGEYFFQKQLPPYAPTFIDTIEIDNDQLMICNKLKTLVWFANHGAIEYHVPFQTIDEKHPNEIVFDLDPPGRAQFDLAIQAALIIKPLLDDLQLISFIKTSGNKGLQIHIPIRTGSMTYEETAIFTQAIAWTVENAYPHLFTTERLKKHRHGRLYIDYVQHGEGKTLIAPYSPRKTADATVATPLYWEEVRTGLTPDLFTIRNVVERIQEFGCPFTRYFEIGRKQKLDKVLSMVRD